MSAEEAAAGPMEIELLRLFVQAMVVDGEVAGSEMDKLQALSNQLGWDERTVMRTIAEEIAQPSPLADLAAAITDPEKRQGAVAACAGIIAADGNFEQAERDFLDRLSTAFGFDASGLIEVIDQALEFLRENPA